MKILPLAIVCLVCTMGRVGATQPADDSLVDAASPSRGEHDGDTPPNGGQPNAKDLLNLEIDQLWNAPVRVGAQAANQIAPSSELTGAAADTGRVTTTADLLKQAPSVSARRVSAISQDPRIRGYHSSQLNGTANGMNQLKARLDIDTIFSQIDPGIVQNITVIDGPYTSLYGPGFAFMAADLLPAPRYESPQVHLSTNFVFGSNAQTLYSRDNVLTGGKDWGACISYGLRTGNDYRTGGPNGYLLPTRYQKWDGMAAISFDVNPISRFQIDCLRTEMNDVQLPGVIYDIENSRNDQYNFRFIIQEDPQGPQDLVLQSWYTQTYYNGDSDNPSKQTTFYRAFLTETSPDADPVNTYGRGGLESQGVRLLRTFGDRDSPQWTVGVDWRRYRQRYLEMTFNGEGGIAWDTLYGIPRSQLDDVGVLTDIFLPLSDVISVNVGGRVDYCQPSVDATDPIAEQYWYSPRYEQNAHPLGMAYFLAKRNLTEASSLRFGASFAMRNPDLTELYNYEAYAPVYRFGNTYNEGNSTLRPEKNIQFDLGLRHETKTAVCGARGFFSMIHDYIMPSPCYLSEVPPPGLATHVLGRNFQYFPLSQRSDIGTPSENADTCQANYVYVNIDQAVMLGGELFGEFEVREGLSLFGNMAYVYGVNNSPVSVLSDEPYYSTDVQIVRIGRSDGLPGIYPLSGNVGIRLREPVDDAWSVEFRCRMVRAQDNVAVTVSEIAAPGYTTFALGGYYRVRKNIRVSLDIENLLNRAYAEPGSLAIIGPNGLPTFVEEPGISALVGIDARF